MLRILHVIGAMNRAGAETLIMNIYRNIDRKSIQFDFLVHTNKHCDYDDEIQKLGGRIFHIRPFNGVNLIEYRSEVNSHLIKHPEHTIIHNHMASTGYVIAKQARQKHRYVILHAHSRNFYSGLRHIAFSLASFPLRFIGDYYLACSEDAAADTFGKSILSKPNYSILKNAIDVALYHCTNEEHLATKAINELNEVPVFGHVGRFIAEKNHIFLLEAFAEIKENLPDAVLLLAGQGPLQIRAREKAAELGISDSVKFLGICDDIPRFLKTIDVFLFPSLNEGLGLAAIEAQAAGATCLISTGVPKMVSIVNCKRIALDDANHWAQRAIQAYHLSQSIDRSKAAQKIAKKGFDISKTVSQICSIYHQADTSTD